MFCRVLFCTVGAVCGLGEYSLDNASGCTKCARGTFSGYFVSSACTPCPAGKFASNLGSRECTTADPAYYASESGRSTQAACPSGKYSSSGASVCTPCDPNGNTGAAYHWLGEGLISDCRCEGGYVGANCNIEGCNTHLPGVSLGLFVLAADKQLRRFSQDYDGSEDSINTARSYLKMFLYERVDLSGDGVITREEMLLSLSYQGIFTAPLVTTVPSIWCPQPPTMASSPPVACFADSVPVATLLADALTNYGNSYNDHTFDGSGSPYIKSMVSTFPDPSYSANMCKQYDHSQVVAPGTSQALVTSWSYGANVAPYTFTKYKVCGYVNGMLDNDYGIGAGSLSSGNQQYFPDDASLASGGYKRINCILLQYYVASIISKSSVIECSVGMYYVRDTITTKLNLNHWQSRSCIQFSFHYVCQIQDGTPMELEPFLMWEGITFSYVDTSSNEEMVSWLF